MALVIDVLRRKGTINWGRGLASDEDTKRHFASAGFEITTLRDTTQTLTVLAMMRHKLETEGLPAVGSNEDG